MPNVHLEMYLLRTISEYDTFKVSFFDSEEASLWGMNRYHESSGSTPPQGSLIWDNFRGHLRQRPAGHFRYVVLMQ